MTASSLHKFISRCKAATDEANNEISSAYTTTQTETKWNVQPPDCLTISIINSSIYTANKYGDKTPLWRILLASSNERDWTNIGYIGYIGIIGLWAMFANSNLKLSVNHNTPPIYNHPAVSAPILDGSDVIRPNRHRPINDEVDQPCQCTFEPRTGPSRPACTPP